MSIAFVSHPSYSYNFPSGHRFPMAKFGLILQRLLDHQLIQTKQLYRPGRIRLDLLELAHCRHYIQGFIQQEMSPQELRRLGIPWSEGLVRRSLISPNGTLLTALLALEQGVACHLAGGTHHAHRDFASGFCIFNDLAVTALCLKAMKKINKILIFDCDVHQGDGTATILAAHPDLFTCSVHCEKNFPARKAQSDLDINLPVAMGDAQYLQQVACAFEQAVAKAQPDLVIYDAGVDVYEHDPLGLLNISLAGIRERDQMVLSLCKQKALPVATVIGGGYDKDHSALAARHCIIAEAAIDTFK